MTTFHLLLLFACMGVVVLPAVVLADGEGERGASGWVADPQRVARETQRQSGVIVDERQVPAYELPDVLAMDDDKRVTRVDDWPERRTAILDTFAREVYGRSPGQPEQVSFELIEENREAMDGQATLRRVAITCEHRGRSHTFELLLFVPNDQPQPIGTFLLLNNRGPRNTDPTRANRSDFWPAEQVIARGYAIAAVQLGQIAADHRERWRDGVVSLFERDPADEDASWRTLAAWAWGASRVMDYFDTDEQIDAQRVAVVGHSRGGKAALWAGASDQRFAMTVSNNSGCGGAALSRRRYGETVRLIGEAFPHWFAPNFLRYADREDALPVDQHMLMSLIAPRALYIASADEDLWADPRGEFLSLAHASPVYALFDEPKIDPDQMPPLNQPLIVGSRGYHIRTGQHNLTAYDWARFLDFANQQWPTPATPQNITTP